MHTKSAICSSHSSSSVSPILKEMLVLPEPKQQTGRKKRAVNSKGVCITDTEIVDELKAKEKAKEEEKMEKKRKKSEKEE